jgi:hypothetical protein
LRAESWATFLPDLADVQKDAVEPLRFISVKPSPDTIDEIYDNKTFFTKKSAGELKDRIMICSKGNF